ncbi:hypothetical protein BCR42DRAFT_426449 [Absidia repens]|uniref:Uncharacterized protein n=1 Tax=Absidia repens TaxID=90262 RepID=A0A1X2I197_9FUNG|nr:hypothetical protein BCR42DRAFT_426449 [Absidia repens]
MVLKSSMFACVLAGVAITQALPMSSNKVNIDKRHKKPLPTALPAAASLTPDQQYVACLINTLYNPPKDKDDRLEYEELINGCIEVVYKTKSAPATATATASDASEQAGPDRPQEPFSESYSRDYEISATDSGGEAGFDDPQEPSDNSGSSSPLDEMAPGNNNPNGPKPDAADPINPTGPTGDKTSPVFAVPSTILNPTPEDKNKKKIAGKPAEKD